VLGVYCKIIPSITVIFLWWSINFSSMNKNEFLNINNSDSWGTVLWNTLFLGFEHIVRQAMF
jgi:hypothetical protein